MLASGLVEEIRGARERGLSREARLAVGIPEILRHLDGEIPLAQCREEIILHTRQLARRQATWFRSFPEIHWVDAAETRSAAAIAIDCARALEIETHP